MRILDTLEAHAGLQGLIRLQSAWDILRIYRTVMRGRVLQDGLPVIAAADFAHRRFWFLLSMSLAVILVAVQAAARLCLLPFTSALPSIHAVILSLLFVAAVGLSFLLRYFAGRWWQEELLLTCGVSRLRVQNI